MIESVRISPAAREQLIVLKRRTGLKHWNELARWALCRSLAEPSRPADVSIAVEDGIEMSWKTFAGDSGDLYWALVQARCLRDGVPANTSAVAHQFRLHVHRGIGYLAGDKSLSDITTLLALSE